MANFKGFSEQTGHCLPTQLIDLLPEITSLAELKCTIALLASVATVGQDARGLTTADLQQVTGLSRNSVAAGLNAAIARGTVCRQPTPTGIVYYPKPCQDFARHACNININIENQTQREDVSNANAMPDVMHASRAESDTAAPERNHLLERILRLGVVPRVANDILAKHDQDYIDRHLNYTEYAIRTRRIKRPAAWFVASIRDDWDPPAGFDETAIIDTDSPQFRKRYAEVNKWNS